MRCMKDGFMEGQILDNRFESLSPLNHGSFGMVFLAKDLKTGEHVAIKCIGKSSINDSYHDAWATDHRAELSCHERLGFHPNIVNLIHAFETEAHVYLVLEYCCMGDLYEAIRLGHGPMQTEHVRSFMLQLVDAVEHMHSKGLYHRDIKPENIFLTQDGSLKLGDFGLSTTESWTYESSVGSDRYMAPEQYDAADTGYDPAQADIWAIGICLLNILFSRNPFVVPDESDVIFRDYVYNSESLCDVFSEMSLDTFKVLEHALSIDPKKRSLTSVRDALMDVCCFIDSEIIDDEFCTEDREVVPASANRQPLRTPSIASPSVEADGGFSWSQTLHMSPPRTARQLSVIPDTELSHDEEVSHGVELSHEDMFDYSAYPVPAETFSLDSVLDSAFNDSVKNMTLREPKPKNSAKAILTPMSASLPISFSKPVPVMSPILGIKETVSKSWSEIYELEMAEKEAAKKAKEDEDPRSQYNVMNWSTESLDQDITIRQPVPIGAISTSVDSNAPTPSLTNTEFSAGRDSEDSASLRSVPSTECKWPSYSPPAKRSTFERWDKWAALGERRRSVNPTSDSEVEEANETIEVKVEVKPERNRGSAIAGLRSWRQGAAEGFVDKLNWMTPAAGSRRDRAIRRNNESRERTGGFWRERFWTVGWEQRNKDKRQGKIDVKDGNDEGVKVMDWQRDAHTYPHLQLNNKEGFEADILSDVEEKSSQEGDIERVVGGWPRLH
ncbi:hypothetical protein MMC30_004443 [Trapelia coarctata]|nr:hypothetical protein [Trapelia coarctata]